MKYFEMSGFNFGRKKYNESVKIMALWINVFRRLRLSRQWPERTVVGKKISQCKYHYEMTSLGAL